MPSRRHSLVLAFALAAVVLTAGAWAVPLGQAEGPSAASATEPGAGAGRKPHGAATRPPSVGERAASFALEAVGVPYRWGGMSLAGFDCSGLVSWAYARVGVELPHSSYALYGVGRRVPRSRIRPGDVLFFSGLGHVGLYLGEGRMVHAPYSGRRVEIVPLGSSHYGRRLVGARRVASA